MWGPETVVRNNVWDLVALVISVVWGPETGVRNNVWDLVNSVVWDPETGVRNNVWDLVALIPSAAEPALCVPG